MKRINPASHLLPNVSAENGQGTSWEDRFRELQREEWTAREELHAARSNFAAIVSDIPSGLPYPSDIPSGLPYPDGVDRIRQAGVRVRFCQRRCQEATKRYWDHMLRRGSGAEGSSLD